MNNDPFKIKYRILPASEKFNLETWGLDLPSEVLDKLAERVVAFIVTRQLEFSFSFMEPEGRRTPPGVEEKSPACVNPLAVRCSWLGIEDCFEGEGLPGIELDLASVAARSLDMDYEFCDEYDEFVAKWGAIAKHLRELADRIDDDVKSRPAA